MDWKETLQKFWDKESPEINYSYKPFDKEDLQYSYDN